MDGVRSNFQRGLRVQEKQPRNRRWLVLAIGLAASSTLRADPAPDFDAAARYSSAHGERALLIWHDGRLKTETYAGGSGRSEPENLFSITKSLASLAVLSAATRGRLDLDEKASATLAEWRNDPRKSRITIRELLTQTSGLKPGYGELYGGKVRDKNRAVLQLAGGAKTFTYGPSHYEALEVLLARKLGRDPVTFLEESVLRPLGIPRRPWRRDRAGHPYFSAGAHLTAREALRVAQVIRRRGWSGFFPLLSGRLMDEAFRGSSENPLYGLGFWTNGRSAGQARDIEEALGTGLSSAAWEGSCLSPFAPADLVVLAGSGGQRIYISPSEKLVVVRFGQPAGFRDPDFLRALFPNSRGQRL